MTRRPQAEDNTEGGFFGRWSKRKARSGRGSSDEETANGDVSAGMHDSGGAELLPEEDRAPEETRQEGEEPVKTDADMPDLESIDESTNLSDFFSSGVSEQLRNQALRRLFHTAKFNVVDPLDDYNESFRDFQLLGDLVTSDMRHRLEMDEERQQQAQLEAELEAEEAGRDVEGGADDEATESDREAEPQSEDESEDQSEDQSAERESERLASESNHDGAPGVDGDESERDSDVESRNKS